MLLNLKGFQSFPTYGLARSRCNILGGLLSTTILLQCHSTALILSIGILGQAGLPGEKQRTDSDAKQRNSTSNKGNLLNTLLTIVSPRTFPKVTSRLAAEHGWTLTRRETVGFFDGSWPSISAGTDVMMVFRRTPERRRCGPGGSCHHFRQSRISC